MNRRKSALNLVMIALAVAVLLIGGYIWLLKEASSSGAAPHMRAVGELPSGDVSSYLPMQAAHTAEALWVLSYGSGKPAMDPPLNMLRATNPDLSRDVWQETHSLLWRQDHHGSFTPVVMIEGTPRLYVDGNHIFLVVPDEPAAVFHSDDQGIGWRQLNTHFSVATDPVFTGVALPPYLHGNDLWIWAETSISTVLGQETMPILYHSSDLGETFQKVDLEQAYRIDKDQVQEVLPEDIEWNSRNTRENHLHAFRSIVQLDDRNAILWVTQQLVFPTREEIYQPTSFTSQIQLQRHDDGQWHVHNVQRSEGEALQFVQQDGDGRIFGMRRFDESLELEVVEFDSSSAQWMVRGQLPNPFSPLPARAFPARLLVGDDLLAVQMFSVFTPFYQAKDRPIIATPFYYSKDLAVTWQRLALQDALGILGFQPDRNRLYLKLPYSRETIMDNGIYAHDF